MGKRILLSVEQKRRLATKGKIIGRQLLAVSQQDTSGESHPTSVRTKSHKLYDDRLFDLILDPLEQENVAEGNIEVCERLRRELENALNVRLSPKKDSKVNLDEDTLKRLKSLGYLK